MEGALGAIQPGNSFFSNFNLNHSLVQIQLERITCYHPLKKAFHLFKMLYGKSNSIRLFTSKSLVQRELWFMMYNKSRSTRLLQAACTALSYLVQVSINKTIAGGTRKCSKQHTCTIAYSLIQWDFLLYWIKLCPKYLK